MQQADQPQPLQLSLGNALLGAVIADGFREAEEELPAPWQADFEDENLANADFCKRLALSCTAGYRYTQQRAPRFTASLDVSLGLGPFDKRQWAVSDQIMARLPSPTTVLLTADTLPKPNSPRATHNQALAQRRSNLKRGSAVYKLSSAYQSIKTLTIDHTVHVQDPVLPLFLPRFSGVTQLRIDDTLTDKWLGLVLDHLPKLDVLTVDSVSWPKGPLAGRECQFTRLMLTEWRCESQQMSELAKLPLATNNRPLHVDFPAGTRLSAYVHAHVVSCSARCLRRFACCGQKTVLHA